MATSPGLPPAEPIDLDDVLDASFLESDSSGHSSVSTELESRKHLKNLSRWDVVSVGAFRQTLETGGNNENPPTRWPSEAGPASDGISYGNAMKANPMGTMLYDNKPPNPSHLSERQACNNGMDISISPVLLPVCDGNRTPTHVPPPQVPQHSPDDQHARHITRKERREKKKKLKSSGPAPHKHQQYQHRHHQHHPNMKSRSSSSMQRTNFFSSPASSVPPLNL